MAGLSGLFMGVGSGSLGAIAVFLKPLTAEFGWLRGEAAFAYLAGSLAMGLGGIVMGALADRFPTRPIVMFGAATVGVAYLLLARHAALWQFYLYSIMLGGLGTAAFDAPLLANLGNWFSERKGLAIGLATAGRSLIQGLLPFLAGVLIAGIGWRRTYLALGVFALGGLVPLALLIRMAPPRRQCPPGAGRGPGPATEPPFPVRPGIVLRWLGVAPIFCCICMATPIVHVVALAQDHGVPAERAAAILLVLFVAAFFGRIFFGRLSDRIGGLHAYILASAAQTALVFWFTQLDTLAGFLVLAALFGFGYSGVMTCVVVCVREMIPANLRGVSQGVVLFLAWAGMGLGGWQGGVLFDLTGSYTWPFANAVLAGLVNLAILAAFRTYLRGRLAEAGLGNTSAHLP